VGSKLLRPERIPFNGFATGVVIWEVGKVVIGARLEPALTSPESRSGIRLSTDALGSKLPRPDAKSPNGFGIEDGTTPETSGMVETVGRFVKSDNKPLNALSTRLGIGVVNGAKMAGGDASSERKPSSALLRRLGIGVAICSRTFEVSIAGGVRRSESNPLIASLIRLGIGVASSPRTLDVNGSTGGDASSESNSLTAPLTRLGMGVASCSRALVTSGMTGGDANSESKPPSVLSMRLGTGVASSPRTLDAIGMTGGDANSESKPPSALSTRLGRGVASCSKTFEVIGMTGGVPNSESNPPNALSTRLGRGVASCSKTFEVIGMTGGVPNSESKPPNALSRRLETGVASCSSTFEVIGIAGRLLRPESSPPSAPSTTLGIGVASCSRILDAIGPTIGVSKPVSKPLNTSPTTSGADAGAGRPGVGARLEITLPKTPPKSLGTVTLGTGIKSVGSEMPPSPDVKPSKALSMRFGNETAAGRPVVGARPEITLPKTPPKSLGTVTLGCGIKSVGSEMPPSPDVKPSKTLSMIFGADTAVGRPVVGINPGSTLLKRPSTKSGLVMLACWGSEPVGAKGTPLGTKSDTSPFRTSLIRSGTGAGVGTTVGRAKPESAPPSTLSMRFGTVALGCGIN
jgi:hypothetical protein